MPPAVSSTKRILGFNQDTRGRKVLDGALAHTAGVGGVFLNAEFGVLTDWTKPAMDMSKPYRPLVANVDADGNETSGVLLPEIAVPLGTYTGWNLYKAPYVEGELCDRDGTYIPFAASRDARTVKGDPRPSLEERYGTHAAYVKKVAEAAQKLVTARLLLKDDAERFDERVNGEDVRKKFSP